MPKYIFAADVYGDGKKIGHLESKAIEINGVLAGDDPAQDELVKASQLWIDNALSVQTAIFKVETKPIIKR
jgi:hypothetical protein